MRRDQTKRGYKSRGPVDGLTGRDPVGTTTSVGDRPCPWKESVICVCTYKSQCIPCSKTRGLVDIIFVKTKTDLSLNYKVYDILTGMENYTVLKELGSGISL